MTRGPFRAIVLAALLLASPHRAAAAIEWLPDTLTTFEGTTRAVERGVLSVAQERSKPEGPRLDLGFLRYRATKSSGGPPVVFIAGGNGIPASFIARIPSYDRFFQRLRATNDVVLFDQRGLGLSVPPLLCLPNHPLPPDVFASEAKARAALDEAFAWCASSLQSAGLDAAAFDPRAAADDVDELRSALGATRIHLVAFSTGTDIALEVLRRHGGNVGRAVLVATRGPGEGWRLPSVFDMHVKRMARFVALDSTYAKRLPDPEASIRAAIAALDAKPVTVPVTDRRSGASFDVTAGGFALQLILANDLVDPLGYSMMPALLVSLASGDDVLFGKKVGQLFNNLSNVINVENVASDCAAGAGPERAARIEREASLSLFGGARTLLQRPELCRAIGASEAPPESRDRVYSTVPTLFLSGSFDGNAPPFQAEEVRWGFPNGVHIVVGNGWHDMIPIPEVQQAIADYLAGQDVGGRRLVSPPLRFLPLDLAKAQYGVGRSAEGR